MPAPASSHASAARSAYTPLPHRQEAFARHVAAGRGYAGAARLSGYAWAGARQTGSRLMKQPEVAARVVELTEADNTRRQAELDELVAAAKRVLLDSMEKQNHFAALRAIDQIARLRGLAGPSAEARSTAFDADPELDDDGASACVGIAEPDAQFDPPMPAAGPAPVEPAPEDPEKAHAKQVKAHNRHTSRCIDILKSRHPELYTRVRTSPSDAVLFFDAGINLLPADRWPGAASPARL